ncbi:hypothetical protein SYK_02850 [Pseudodesulfovibrio nedwellii]|uniref:Uncharacterized protein n=1 Tax=Pseudodesulfovibrio nedwellii TaxID=2973072 RepID=A0ABM8AWM1_9BACT|nr:hypothetical protein [Pseudodesulfovibrio nedwellii]BDQ35925.1 hypothetical protein SYK_02850 [Pseudodesulfovibrio nedwellii]
MSDVKLPKQVEEQGKRADEAAEAMMAGKTDPKGDGTPGEPAPESEPAAAPGPEPSSEPGTPEPEPAKAPDDLAALRHQLDVLQGKYDAEVPTLSREKRRLQGLVNDLTGQNTALQSQLETALVAANANPAGGTDVAEPHGNINPEDMADYGDEFVTMARENNELKAQVETMSSKLDELTGQVGSVVQTTTQTSYEKFTNKLNDELSDWDAINNDPDFISYLDDEGTLTVFQAHAQNHDVAKTVKFMRRFVAESGKSYGTDPMPPASPAAPAPTPVLAQAPTPQPSVEPSSQGALDVDPQQQGLNYTTSQVKEFYQKFALAGAGGAFRPFNVGSLVVNTKADADRIDSDITLAGMQGRVLEG